MLLSQICNAYDSDSDDESNYEEEIHASSHRNAELPDKENYSLLAIAHYNVGSQLEFLNRYDECKASFKRSVKVIKKFLDSEHPLLGELHKSLRNLDK